METLTGQSARKQYLSKSQKEQILKEHLEQATPISQLAIKNGITVVNIKNLSRSQMKSSILEK